MLTHEHKGQINPYTETLT